MALQTKRPERRIFVGVEQRPNGLVLLLVGLYQGTRRCPGDSNPTPLENPIHKVLGVAATVHLVLGGLERHHLHVTCNASGYHSEAPWRSPAGRTATYHIVRRDLLAGLAQGFDQEQVLPSTSSFMSATVELAGSQRWRLAVRIFRKVLVSLE